MKTRDLLASLGYTAHDRRLRGRATEPQRLLLLPAKRDGDQADSWSHACSACGKCCNSAPPLSLPELFYHQHRFIGGLALRRIHRPHLADFERLAQALGHRTADSKYDVLLTLQALDVPQVNRCPMLQLNGHCAVHNQRKPSACSAVPLDSMVPNRRQNLVLAERLRDSRVSGASCVVQGVRTGHRPLLRDGQLDPAAAEALERHREALIADQQHWGRAVFQQLEPALLQQTSPLAQLPEQGLLIMSLAPVLLVISSYSEACRRRCLAFVSAQMGLIQFTLYKYQPHGISTEPVFSRLQKFFDAYARTRIRLLERGPRGHATTTSNHREIERWLELADDESPHLATANAS